MMAYMLFADEATLHEPFERVSTFTKRFHSGGR